MTRWAQPTGVAFLVFLGVAPFVAAVVGTVHGHIPPAAVHGSVVVALIAAIASFQSCRESTDSPGPDRWDWVAAAALGIASLRHFGWLLYESGGSLWTADKHNRFDLPLHWTFIENFARGARFWPDNPVYTGARLQYPLGIDLFDALLVRLGLPLPGTLCLLGLGCAALLGFWLWRWGRGFAIAAFLFSGGAEGTDAAWKNLFLAHFVPQRGFLFALPAGLLLLWSWRQRLLRQSRGLSGWVEGILWGVMPLFHLHTFVFLSLVFAGWTLHSRRWSAAWTPLVWAVVPATWAVFQVTDGFHAASLVWWEAGWMMLKGPHGSLVFLLLNFTLFLPLFLWATLRAVRRGDREGLNTLVPGLALWIALFFVMLAPWDWDNTKVMIWCYVLMLPAAARLALDTLPVAARAGLIALLLAPGMVTLGLSLLPDRAFELGSVDEIEGVCAAVRTLPLDARVATVQVANHPVALCGQPIVAGFTHHLWTYGIDSAPTEVELQVLMWGLDGWRDRAKNLSARFVFWGSREAKAFAASRRPWEAECHRVSSGEWGSLYDLEAAAP